MKNCRKITVYCVTILFCISTIVQSATEAEQFIAALPDNTLGFIASSGTDSLKADFDKTFLGQIWNDPSFQTFYGSLKNELLRALKESMPDQNDIKLFNRGTNTTRLLLSRPFVLTIVLKDDPQVPLYGFLVINAGPKKEQFTELISEMEALGDDEIIDFDIAGAKMHAVKDNDKIMLYWGFVQDRFIFAVNDQQGLALKNIKETNPQASHILNNVPATDDALVIHIDFQKNAQLIKSIASKPADKKDIEIIRKVIHELGLANVKTFSARVGFKDTDVVADALLEVPEPRTGLLAVQKPVDLEVLKIIDENAVMACTCCLDLAAVYDRVLEAVKIASPNEVYFEVSEAIAKFEARSNCSIRKGLLAGLEGPMTFYSLAPGYSIQTPTGAIVAVVSLSDPNLFAANLTALGEFIAEKTKDSRAGIQIRSQQQNGRNVTMWVLPFLAYMQIIPCWTIVDNRLIICTNPAHIDPVVKRIKDLNPAGSLYTSEGFRKIMSNLPAKITCLKYINSELDFNYTMLGVQQFWPIITMGAAQNGIKLPLMLPQLGHISQKMRPVYNYSFSDSTGLRFHYRGLGIEQSLTSVAFVSMLMAILMPALARVRQLAQRIISAEHLSAIGKACIIYANDHDGKFPPDLETLAKYADLPSKILASPRKPPSFQGPDYIYIADQDISMDPANIIAYENPEYCSEGVNVLYLDGHVEFEKPDQFRKELEETYNRLKRSVPEIKFRREIEEETD